MKSFKFDLMNPIMLSQEQLVLLAMSHSGGHSTTTVFATIHLDNFYSYSRWMEEKDRHIIYQNNAIKIICLDKQEIL